MLQQRNFSTVSPRILVLKGQVASQANFKRRMSGAGLSAAQRS